MRPANRLEIVVSLRTLVLVAAAAALAWVLASIRDALLLIFVAAFLAVVLEPLVRRIETRTRLGRGPAAGIVVGGFVALAALAVTAVLVPLVTSLHDFIVDLPDVVERIRASQAFRSLDRRFDLGGELQERAVELAGDAPGAAIDLVGIGGAVAEALLSTLAVAFLTLFLLIDLPRLEGAIHSVLEPETSDRVARLRAQIGATISRYALGALSIAVIAGAVEGGAAWLLGAPFPLALALIAGLLDLIPQIGATIGGVILVLVTLTEGVPQAAAMLVVVVVYQQIENYVLQPAIQGRAAQISGFFVVASVVIGASLLGVLGALVAVPLAASIQIVLREVTADRRARMEALRAERGGGPEGVKYHRRAGMNDAKSSELPIFRRILCGVDGTPPSLDAARQAVRLEDEEGAVELVAVANLAKAAHAGMAATHAAELLRAEAEAALAEAGSIAPSASSRLLDGDPVAVLLREAENASLIAVGSHSRRRAAGILVGTVAARMLRDAPCSVLIARPERDPESWPQSIVVGVDGSPESAAALAVARSVAERFGGRLRVLAATNDQHAADEMRAIAPELEERPGRAVDVLVVVSESADLVLVGSRGLHGLKALGSVSERVAHQAQSSVLVVRPAHA